MKKVLTILLVLLVTSVVFAAPPAPTTVDITTTNTGVLSHKITAAVVTGNPTWNNATAVTTKSVDISSTADQSVAFYSLRTNTKKAVTVTVTADALHTTAPAYHIPYTLTVGSGTEAKTGDFGSYTASATAPTVFPSIELATGSINAHANGMRFLSQEIKVKFSENYADSALEGEYISTIKFAITTD